MTTPLEDAAGAPLRVPEPGAGTEVPAAPQRGLRQAVSALQYPNFARFWTGAVISNSGTWMQNVTVPYVLYHQTHSASLVGFAGFCQFIPTLFVGPIGGWLADRHHRRTVLLWTQFAHAALAVALWLTYAAGFRAPALIIGIVFLTGVVQGLNVPAWQSYFPALVPRHAMLNAVTLNSAQFNAARAIGPAVAGVVLAQLGASWAFLINAASYGAVIVALLSIPSSVGATAVDRPRQALVEQVRGSVRYVRRTPGILVAIGLVTVGAGLGQPILQLMPVIAEEVFHAEAWRYGLMTASLGTGGVIGAVVLGSLGSGHRRSTLVRRSLALYVVAMLGVGVAPTYAAGVVALLASGMLYLIFVAPLNTSVQMQSPEHMRGGVIALYVMTFNLAYPVGSLIQGVLADVIGPRETVVGASLGIGVAGVVARRRRAFDSLDADLPDEG